MWKEIFWAASAGKEGDVSGEQKQKTAIRWFEGAGGFVEEEGRAAEARAQKRRGWAQAAHLVEEMRPRCQQAKAQGSHNRSVAQKGVEGLPIHQGEGPQREVVAKPTELAEEGEEAQPGEDRQREQGVAG